MLQVLIPISDNQVFFPKEDYFFPKPIIEILNKPLIVQVVKQLEKSLDPDLFIFVIPKELEAKWAIKNIISLALIKSSKFFIRENNTSGSLSSCLLASDLIDEGELIIANMDELIDYNLLTIIKTFRESNSSAGLLAFKSFHPRWAYALLEEKNKVIFCAEKKVISKFAIAGFYYFSNKKLFIDSSSKALLEEDSYNSQFFLSSSINQVILMGEKVTAYEIDTNNHHSLFSPTMIDKFISCDFSKSFLPENSDKKEINIIIPAAGKGSRFKNAGWKKPKPFIDINGRAMIEHVIDNISINQSNIFLILQEQHIKDLRSEIKTKNSNNLNLITIDYLTSGTACTLLHARKMIDNETPLLIANSDQIVNFDCELFIKDALKRNLDGSILVFKDNSLNPKWSFVKTDPNKYVSEVAEKNPISNLATVGIYFFRKGSYFIDAALEMIKHDERVNNEFYTCPVYNYLIKDNRKIGIYEIDQISMHGLGTPEDLEKYQKYMHFPKSLDQPK